MANLPEQARWEDGIYQLETSDPVLAGPDGIDNRQATQLGNRTAYLKEQVESINEVLSDQAEKPNPFEQYMLREAVAAQAGPLAWLGTASGTANALTFALPAGSKVDAYQGGQYFQFKAAAANTEGVTAKIGTLAAKAILKSGGPGLVALDAGDLKPGVVYALTFDGQQFQLGSGASSSIAALPVGSMIPLPRAEVPTGFLELDGGVHLAAKYPDLAAYLGTTYNKGNEEAGYFRLPDSRGEFFRGWDHGRGVDAARALGSYQLDAFKRHNHGAPMWASSSFDTTGGPNFVGADTGGSATGVTSSNITSTGDDETRPRNLAVMWCIKAWSAPVNPANIDIAVLAAEVDTLRALSLIGGRQGLKVSAMGASPLVSVVADQLILGSVVQAKKLSAINLSIDSSKAGANGFDTGVLPASAWCSIWVIWGDAPGVAGLLSMSGTAPTLPPGYTHKVRVGWARTDGTANKYPIGFVQSGRNVQLLALRDMASGVLSQWTAIATGNFVPPTAVAVVGRAQNSNLICAVAPNASYDAWGVAYVYLPSGNGTASQQFRIQLESANIYGFSTASGSKISLLGWEDDL